MPTGSARGNKFCDKRHKKLTSSAVSSTCGFLNNQSAKTELPPMPNSRAVSSIDARKAVDSVEACDEDDSFGFPVRGPAGR